MHDVFISYSHKDVQVADAICHELEDHGVRCWYAPRNIQPGVEWAEAIIEALEACEVLVLVFTDYSNSSQQVLREVDAAITAGKAIIPFKRTESMPTGSMRYYLSALHWLDVVDEPLEAAIDELVTRVCGLLGREASAGGGEALPNGDARKGMDDAAGEHPAAGVASRAGGAADAPAAPASPAAAKSKVPLIAGIVAACLAVVLGVFFMGRGSSGDSSATPSQEGAVQAADVADSGSSSDASGTDVTDGTSSTEGASSIEDAGSGEGTDKGSGEVSYGASSSEPEKPTVTPQPGDEEAKDNYLYTLQYNDTEVRLDHYMGPETEELVIPTTIEGVPVTGIGEKCFEDATWIKKLVLPEALESISYRAFYGCSNLREMNIPASLTRIGGWAFAHTGFTDIVFPETFESLDYGAFYGSDLRNCVLSSKVDWLGENTFRMCPDLESVTIPAAEVEINAKAFEADTDVTIIGVAGSYTEKYAKGMNLKFEAYGG